MSDLFWKRLVLEYLPQLQDRQNWTSVKRNFKPGDIVLIVDNTAPRNSWLMGRVIQTFPNRRGCVRHVKVKTKSSYLDYKTVWTSSVLYKKQKTVNLNY